MLQYLEFIIISTLMAFGMAVALVEKGDTWPISKINNSLKLIFGKINKNLPKMLECTVCTSFWTTLLSDVIVGSILGYRHFSWPFSGFITLGFTWAFIQFVNAIDSPKKMIIENKAEEDE